MYCVISTVGRSIFANAKKMPELNTFIKNNPNGYLEILSAKHNFPGQDLYDEIIQHLHAVESDVNELRGLSAEFNSLVKILGDSEPHRSDQLHFIASETPDGILGAKIIADFAEYYFKREAKIWKIDGLQVNDSIAFRRVGLRNLIKKVYELLEKAPAGTYTRVLNPTGGFKAAIPYLTLIGMLQKGVEMSYIYEQSKELMTLSGLPIQLDFVTLEPYYKALVWCQEEAVVSEKALRTKLQYEDLSLVEHPIWPLLEYDGKDYTISGLGEIVVEHFKEKSQKKVYLSKEATERYEKTDPGSERRKNYEKIFDHIHDPIWREKGHRHSYTETTLPAIKLGAENERAFYKEYGDYILILELALHLKDGSYDRVPQKATDYDRFRLWEGTS